MRGEVVLLENLTCQLQAAGRALEYIRENVDRIPPRRGSFEYYTAFLLLGGE
jgi:hypothetical protein